MPCRTLFAGVVGPLIFTELQSLQFNIDNILLTVFSNDSKDFHIWIGTDKHLYEKLFYIPYFKHPVVDHFLNARKKGKNLLKEIFTKKL